MAVPTLQDVLDAIAQLDAKVDQKVDALRSDVDAHRAETKKGFADLDKELTGHREIEKDIAALKVRPARTAARATRRPRSR